MRREISIDYSAPWIETANPRVSRRDTRLASGGYAEGDEASELPPGEDAREIDLVSAISRACDPGRLSAAPGGGSDCPRDRGRRSRGSRTVGRSAPGRPRRRRPAAARKCP